MHWARTMLGADIRTRLEAARSSAERAWLLDEELTRRFEHRRPRYGLCECEHEFFGYELYWWPFPAAQDMPSSA